MKVLAEIPADAALVINKTEKPEKLLASYIQKKLGGGRVVVDYWVGVMENPKNRQADRLKASELLANRAWGKPKETLTVEASNGLDQLSLEQLVDMAAAWNATKNDIEERESDYSGEGNQLSGEIGGGGTSLTSSG